jgi:hypothetical protein
MQVVEHLSLELSVFYVRSLLLRLFVGCTVVWNDLPFNTLGGGYIYSFRPLKNCLRFVKFRYM